MLERFSLKVKLLFLCGTLIFFILLVGGVSKWGSNQIDDSYNKIVTSSLPKITSIDRMYLSYQQVRIHLRTLGFLGLTQAQKDEAVEKTLEAIKRYEAEFSLYKKMPVIEGEEKLVADLEHEWSDFKQIGNLVLDLHKKGGEENHNKMRAIFLKDCPEAAAAYDRSINNLLEFENKNAKSWVDSAISTARETHNIQNIIMVFGLVSGLCIGYFFALNVSQMINAISSRLDQGSDTIAQIITEVAKASHSLSANITQQASALQQTTAAVEETSATIESNAENAKKSAEVSELSKGSVNDGKAAVEEVMASINDISASTIEIRQQIEQSNQEISDIVKIIGDIESKTKIINEIVFQTKLLSFNASVEAARAGEHGKGFAVVAEEIGNLARMSGDSAKEISSLLEASTNRVQKTVESSKTRIASLVEKSQKKVDQGNETAQKCSVVLDEIFSNVNSVNNMIMEISTASNEQSLSIQEIKKAMTEIDSASTENTRSSSQAREAAEHLETQVQDFKGLVVQLNAIVSGKKAA